MCVVPCDVNGFWLLAGKVYSRFGSLVDSRFGSLVDSRFRSLVDSRFGSPVDSRFGSPVDSAMVSSLGSPAEFNKLLLLLVAGVYIV